MVEEVIPGGSVEGRRGGVITHGLGSCSAGSRAERAKD